MGRKVPSSPACVRSGRRPGPQPWAPRIAAPGSDSDRFTSGKGIKDAPADGWATSLAFAFPFIISAFIIMKRMPELIKVCANTMAASLVTRSTEEDGRVSCRRQDNLTVNPINLIPSESTIDASHGELGDLRYPHDLCSDWGLRREEGLTWGSPCRHSPSQTCLWRNTLLVECFWIFRKISINLKNRF